MKVPFWIWILPLATAAYCSAADDTSFVMLGKDRLEFPASYALPTKSKQQELASEWSEDGELRKQMGQDNPFLDLVQKEIGQDSPFLDSVQFATGWEHLPTETRMVTPYAIRRLDTGVYARPQWDNIGYFIKTVKTRAECESLISVLHRHWRRWALSGLQFQAVADSIRSDQRKLPLKVVTADIDMETLSKRCFVENGTWFVHFITFDDATLIENKYAIDSRNRVAHRSRVLVEGPPDVPFSEPKYDNAVSGLQGLGPESDAHKSYLLCKRFLWRAAFLKEWRKDLRSSDSTRRREAAQKMWCLLDEAAGAVPELTGELANEDWRTRYNAASALLSAGPAGRAALPELRKLLRDKNPEVREAAAQAVFALGAGDARIVAAQLLGQYQSQAGRSLMVLRDGLKDENPAVRAAATAAIEVIEREGK
jgi:hypothetical protein